MRKDDYIVLVVVQHFLKFKALPGRVFAPFWCENGYSLAQFGLESGLVFEGTTGVYERIYRFNSKWLRKN